MPVCRRCLRAPEPLLAEFFCVSCRAPFRNPYPLDEDGRCRLCRSGAQGFDFVYSFGAYEGVLRRLIHLYKYSRMHPLAKPLGSFLALALPREQQFDAVVPVPLHWHRRWQRGFNQSELLARSIARLCGVPLRQSLRRRRATRVQAGLTGAMRRENVRAAFSAKPGAAAGMRILLVDDVFTTGATASACAHALKRAGAKSVTVLTLARVDRRVEEGAQYKWQA